MKDQPKKTEHQPVLFRFTDKQYEYLSRSAYESGSNSMQEFVNKRLFKNIDDELTALRAKQKKLGVQDSRFYTPKERKKMGLKVRRGRRKLPLKEWR